MIEKLKNYFADKKVLILGFGREGQSTYRLIRRLLPEKEIFIADQKEEPNEIIRNDTNVTYVGGENYLDGLHDYDVIMKTPGVSLKKLETEKFRPKIKSELELFLEFFGGRTIGVTGTKGKSTTSSLIHQVLNEQGMKSLLMGNIGVPVFDMIDEIDDETTVVLEMSSHQLEYMERSPKIAVLLNIYPEHLDHYRSFDDYALAKCNIFKFQKPEDYFLYNDDDETLARLIRNTNGKTMKVSLAGKAGSDIYLRDEKVYVDGEAVYDKNEKRNLVGEHNLNDIMFVFGVAKILGLDFKKAAKTVNEFKPLKHRMELVGRFEDVLYYDNSIATIPEATIEAVKALGEVDTLIIGGMDRGISYESFVEFLNQGKVRNVICMPKTGHDIAKKLTMENKYIVETLEEAVETARKVTAKNKICLLSPAAASYGFFKNFEEKGDLYQSLVKNMI